MAKEYIDRMEVYAVACKGCTRHGEEYGSCYSEEPCERLALAFTAAPAADVVEVVHAQWEIEMDDMGWNKHTCPNCGYVKRTDIHVSLGWNYCPNCGAKMDGDNNA